MDSHDLTSYPLKLPFIRSSKIARRDRFYERTKSAECDARRFNSHGESAASQPQNITQDASSKRSFVPYRKTAIEIQLENFRTKAVRMGFCSGSSRSPGDAGTSRAASRAIGDDDSNSSSPRWPQSQPPLGKTASYEDSHFVWPQNTRERRTDTYNTSPSTPPFQFSSQQITQTSWSKRSDTSPLFEDLRFSQPNRDSVARYSFGSSGVNFDEDSALPDQSISEAAAHGFGSQRPRSRPTDATSIPCGALPHEFNHSPALPRYCRWDSGSRVTSQRSPWRSEDRFRWRRSGSRLYDSSDFLQSPVRRPENSRSRSRKGDFLRLRNHSNPLLRTKNAKDDDEIPHRPNVSLESMYASPDSLRKIERPHRNTYGLDFEDDNKERYKNPTFRTKAGRQTERLILNLSPIAKSSPCPSCCVCRCCRARRSSVEKSCHFCKKVSVATKGVQTKLSHPFKRGHSLVDVCVQTDSGLSVENLPQIDNSSTRRPGTSEAATNAEEGNNNSESEHEEAVCRSIVASDSGEGTLGDFLIGVEREP